MEKVPIVLEDKMKYIGLIEDTLIVYLMITGLVMVTQEICSTGFSK